MSYSIDYTSEAQDDISSAYCWYELKVVGLGEQFLDSLYQIEQIILKNPVLFPKVLHDIRRAVVHKFPYSIFYEIIETRITVISVMHTSKKPKE